jgi:hypothetical protein
LGKSLLSMMALPVLIMPIEWLRKFNWSLGTVYLLFLLCFVVYVLFLVLHRWLRVHMSLVSNAPLRSSIAGCDLEALRTSSTRVYCTMSTTTRYAFPFAPTYIPDVWLPVYVALNNCENTGEVHSVLTQSAAIPEIFSGQIIRGRLFVGGGLADNTPLLPVLRHAPGTVIVIYLDHEIATGSALRRAEKERISRVMEDLQSAQLLTHEQTIELKRKADVAAAIIRSALPQQQRKNKLMDLWCGRRHWWFPTIYFENPTAPTNPRTSFLPMAEMKQMSEDEQNSESKWMKAVIQAIKRTKTPTDEKRKRLAELHSGNQNYWLPLIFPDLFDRACSLEEGRACSLQERIHNDPCTEFDRTTLLAIIPSEPLQMIKYSGTLNFFARKAHRLMRIGYKNVLETLRHEAYATAGSA